MKTQDRLPFQLPVANSFVEGDAKIIAVTCLSYSWWKVWILFPTLILSTAGFWLLVIYWSVEVRLKFLFKYEDLLRATHFYIKHNDNTASFAKKIRVMKKKHSGPSVSCYGFIDRDLVYYYDMNKRVIRALEFDIQHFYNVIYTTYGSGLTQKGYEENLKIFGKCQLNINIPTLFYLCITELLDPIFFIQILAVIVWIIEGYTIYAIVIIFLIAVSSILNILLLRNHLKNIKNLSLNPYDINVIRVIDYNKVKVKQPITDLVPGDVFEIEDNMQIPCDCLLLNGELLMNESSVTGENLPKKKTSIPYYERLFEYSQAERHTIYEGSLIIKRIMKKGESSIQVLVLRTGFSSMRGQLIRSIIHHKSEKLLMMRRQFYKYMLIMFLLAILGNFCSIPLFMENEDKNEELLYMILDLITVTVSPILPCCTLISLSLSLSKLKYHQISCSSPYKLLTVGSIETACFDKTGTLTEKEMKLKGLRVFVFPSLEDNMVTSKAKEEVFFAKNIDDIINDETVREAYLHSFNLISTCHSLIKIDDQVVGEPIDKEMFTFSKAFIESKKDQKAGLQDIQSVFRVKSLANELLKTNEPNDFFSIIRIFEFSSERQSMSVIALNERSKHIYLYTKGSPEKILEACTPGSVNISVWNQIKNYSKEGFVILGMAFKKLSVYTATLLQVIENNDLETDMTFLGLLVYENKLKANTLETMQMLSKTSINLKIVTGDSPVTACAVASLCGIIDISKHILLVDIMDDPQNIENKKLILRDNILGLAPRVSLSINENLLAKSSNRMLITDREIELTNSVITEISIYKPLRHDTKNIENAISLMELSGPKLMKRAFRLSNRTDFLAELFTRQELMDDSRTIVITGNAFYFLFNDENYKKNTFSEEKNRLLTVFLNRIKILARMMPFHKSFLIQKLQENNIVAMVGDGLNDCGALKRADVGYSLGHGEASLSSAFSSHRDSIKSFVDLLREGRVTVNTLKHTIKYISFMSILQFSTQLILSLFLSGLTDTQFLIQDLFVVTFLILACSTTPAEYALSKKVPWFDMGSLENMIGFVGAIGIQISSQIGIIFWIRSICEYQPCGEPEEIYYDIYGYNPICQESHALFLLTLIIGINYILITDTFKPHRRPFYANWIFMIIYLSLNIYTHIAIFYEPAGLAWFEINYEILPLWVREVIVGVAWMVVAGLAFFEFFIVRVILGRLMERYKKRKLRGVVRLLSASK